MGNCLRILGLQDPDSDDDDANLLDPGRGLGRVSELGQKIGFVVKKVCHPKFLAKNSASWFKKVCHPRFGPRRHSEPLPQTETLANPAMSHLYSSECFQLETEDLEADTRSGKTEGMIKTNTNKKLMTNLLMGSGKKGQETGKGEGTETEPTAIEP